jgi:MFS family permease
MTAFSRLALSRYLTLYAALYAGFGVLSPYLPSLLESRDLRPEAIALVLAAGSAVRLAAGPAAGRLADRLDASKVILPLLNRGGVDRTGVSAGAGPVAAIRRGRVPFGRSG